MRHLGILDEEPCPCEAVEGHGDAVADEVTHLERRGLCIISCKMRASASKRPSFASLVVLERRNELEPVV
ncbi:MAG: hypothetical protein JWQ92_1107 [Amnibacterium sp.]|nr:hypothetical protein [Amnibacterium sp.]